MGEKLLLEIGMEECPARFVEPALADLAALTEQELRANRLAFGGITTLGTPRRLAVIVAELAERQEDLEEEVKGPPARIAFDENGAPTRAAQGFASKQGVDLTQLISKEIDGGEYVYAVKKESGKSADEVLPDILRNAITTLRFPKSMRWNSEGLRFARPIRWIVALHRSRVIPFEIAGVQSGRSTYGHRFLSESPFPIERPEQYVEAMRQKGKVIVDVAERHDLILRQVTKTAQVAGEDARALLDEDLLLEVTHLVEYPTALLGSFDADYLRIPEEILITSMRAHQKYFPVVNAGGKLLPHFVTVRNGDDRHLDVVRSGNERVLSARLADAKFFYDEDLKTPLETRVTRLKDVIFQERLGTVWEKQERVQSIVGAIGRKFSPDIRRLAERSAYLAKADLVTQVVYEFPELQGVMGREYASTAGEPDEVAEAIFEHYLPRHAADVLPQTEPGILVSIADKIDTIVGCFAVDLIPSGSADPYALRRQALGILKIQLAYKLPVSLGELIDAAINAYGDKVEIRAATRQDILEFFSGRLNTLLVERGIRYDLVEASLARGVEDIVAAEARAEALAATAGSENFESIRTAYQRAANLAAKAEGTRVDPLLFEHDEERELWQIVQEIGRRAVTEAAEYRFDKAIDILSELRGPVDAFFETVLVMAKDEEVRQNRLALLSYVVEAFAPIGDLTRVTEP